MYKDIKGTGLPLSLMIIDAIYTSKCHKGMFMGFKICINKILVKMDFLLKNFKFTILFIIHEH